MAIRGAKHVIQDSVDFRMDEVAERGGIVCGSTFGSGNAMDSAAAKVTYAANPSGLVPIGMLMCDVVYYDLTKQIQNDNKEEVQKGRKVTLMEKGWAVTNKVMGTPAVHSVAYLHGTGIVSPTMHSTGGVVATPVVGTFRSILDANGFAKLNVNLPLPRNG